MTPILLIDFGSTYTKLTAVDISAETILGTASAYTTVQSDIGTGFKQALSSLEQQIGLTDFAETYACSSAAGGLKMMTSGLVPELTSEAAELASLGAGAKVMKVFSFELTADDLEDIKNSKPDIFLLVGGTDGGNTECIIHNAKALASINPNFPIIIAGNRVAAKHCKELLSEAEVFICENVMPKFGVLNISETQSTIRDIFLRKIIYAKGLSDASSLLSDIIMPTPSAVLKAMELLADGTESESGIGELITVDVGGATTDVYSLAEGKPSRTNTIYKGLPEPYAKRTVEGDIGMRYSIRGIIEAAGMDKISDISGLSHDKIVELVDNLSDNTDLVPNGDPELESLDYALASMAIDIAVSRHTGKIEETYTLMGQTFVQTGKDLTSVRQVIVTGGSLVHAKRNVEIAKNALYSIENPMVLKPLDADIKIDTNYILAAMGLLSTKYPDVALRIMKKELK